MPQILGIITLILLIYITSLNLVERSFYEILGNTKKLDVKDYTFANRDYCEALDKDSNKYLGICSEGFFFPQDEIINEKIISCNDCEKIKITSSGSISIIGGEVAGPIRGIPGYFKPNLSSAIGESYEFEGDIGDNSFFLTGSILGGGKVGIVKEILKNTCNDENLCNNITKTNMEDLIMERVNDELFIYMKDINKPLKELYFRFTTITSDESESTQVKYLKKD